MTTIADYLTNDEVMRELGLRLKEKRLERNLPIALLAEHTGLNRKTVMELEAGEDVKLSSLIKVLRGLNLLGMLEGMLPDTLPSGQALSTRGTVRKNAYRPGKA